MRHLVRRSKPLQAALLSLLAITATLVIASPAHAAGWIQAGGECPYGRACAWDIQRAEWWVANGCGFHNMGDQGFSDRTDYYWTYGNAIRFGQYKGSGDTHNTGNFTWGPLNGAWTHGYVNVVNYYDAMFVNC